MAKHGKKKVYFSFDDLDFAAFFLDFIRRKSFYARITASMNAKGGLEITFVGSAESVRMGIQKLKKLYNRARELYATLPNISYLEGALEEAYRNEFGGKDSAGVNGGKEAGGKRTEIKFDLKKLKFDVG